MFHRFYALWAINAPLEPARLRRQLEAFRACGFDGVIWHPRFYPGQPPYLGNCYLTGVSEVILHAKSLGLAFWIYDEDGWPSGTVGGQLLIKYPADAQCWAELVPEVETERGSVSRSRLENAKTPGESSDSSKCEAAAAHRPALRNEGSGSRVLAAFQHAGTRWSLVQRIGQGVDYFNPDLARHFIELTYERYRTGLPAEAWEHVAAMFSDEPEFGLGHAYDSLSPHGAIPWTPKLPELFRQRHGGDLLAHIADIFFDGPNAPVTRVRFWELLTDVFNKSFTSPINDWCSRHGKLFTAHVKGEEHPLFQVPTTGSCHQFFRHLSLPAIDALERYPANNFFPRQVSSAARQFGHGRCMVEAFGGAGWGATPEDLERYLLWLGRNGLTDFVLHLSQYRLDSAAMHDWPPSQPLHLTWRDAHHEVLRRVRAELQKNPRPVADTLVIAPNRGIMATYAPREFLKTNVHNAATYPDSVAGKINRAFLARVETLHREGVKYDVADERTVETFGRVAAGKLAVGNCEYARVIESEGCELNASARQLIEPLVAGAPASGTARLVGVQALACPGSTLKRELQRAVPEAGAPIPIGWQLATHPVNCLLLECVPGTDGWFAAEFSSLTPLLHAGLEAVFADDIAGCMLNGKSLLAKASDEGSRIKIGLGLVPGSNTLRFQTAHPVERPFVWLHGRFRVESKTPFVAGPRETIQTGGPFQLQPARDGLQRDLVADGFPFLCHSLAAIATVDFPEAIGTLRLDGGEADAIRLTMDDRDFGWQWRAQAGVCFAGRISAGLHRLKIELVPNTFNAFGPHHYYGGDWPVISPDQIRGRRNFADPADAPAHTHIQTWHFRRFILPQSLSALPAEVAQ